MKCSILGFGTIEIDEGFPWKDLWGDALGGLDSTVISEVSPRNRIKLNYTRKLSREGMLKFERSVYATEQTLLDRKYRVRFGKSEDYYLELWTNNACLEWLSWLIQLILLHNGATTIHCATVAKNGNATIFAGSGGIGKTSIIKLLVSEMGWDYMGDDYIIAGKNGMCYGYPTGLAIYPYHRDVFPEIFLTGRGPLSPTFAKELFSDLATLSKRLLRPFPKALQFARRHNPQSVRIDPAEVFGRNKFASQAILTNVVWLDRSHDREDIVLERDRDRDSIASCVFGSTLAEFDWWCSRLINLAMSKGIVAADDVYPVWLGILKEAFRNASLHSLLLPFELKFQDMRDAIHSTMEQIE